MVICFDAGNTDLVCGLFCADNLTKTMRFGYKKGADKAEYLQLIRKNLSDNGVDISEIDGCVLCCVAPNTAQNLSAAMEELFGCAPVIFKNDSTCRLNILTEDPSEVGTDIIASCMAAKEIYPMPCVVVDMGTATTLTAMDKDANVLGVSIITGVYTSMTALEEKTGLTFEKNLTSQPKAIGTNTQKSIDSGLILGSAYAVDGLIDAIEAEIGQGRCSVVATGGISGFIIPHCKKDITLNGNLLLQGLYCYYKNSII